MLEEAPKPVIIIRVQPAETLKAPHSRMGLQITFLVGWLVASMSPSQLPRKRHYPLLENRRPRASLPIPSQAIGCQVFLILPPK